MESVPSGRGFGQLPKPFFGWWFCLFVFVYGAFCLLVCLFCFGEGVLFVSWWVVFCLVWVYGVVFLGGREARLVSFYSIMVRWLVVMSTLLHSDPLICSIVQKIVCVL